MKVCVWGGVFVKYTRKHTEKGGGGRQTETVTNTHTHTHTHTHSLTHAHTHTHTPTHTLHRTHGYRGWGPRPGGQGPHAALGRPGLV